MNEMTSLMIPVDLKEKAERSAELMGISLDQFVRDTLEARLGSLKRPRSEDPLFNFDDAYDGPAPSDLAINHDKYLYGDDD